MYSSQEKVEPGDKFRFMAYNALPDRQILRRFGQKPMIYSPVYRLRLTHKRVKKNFSKSRVNSFQIFEEVQMQV
jgi:hypothetical protein